MSESSDAPMDDTQPMDTVESGDQERPRKASKGSRARTTKTTINSSPSSSSAPSAPSGSGGKKLATTVHVDGQIYGPGDTPPAEVAARITNPKAWA